ncbi:MAG: hypothetical protein LAT58_03930 [Opitutales bacterium]|nr:hypothetical protein [Opitutales bacterium]
MIRQSGTETVKEEGFDLPILHLKENKEWFGYDPRVLALNAFSHTWSINLDFHEEKGTFQTKYLKNDETIFEKDESKGFSELYELFLLQYPAEDDPGPVPAVASVQWDKVLDLVQKERYFRLFGPLPGIIDSTHLDLHWYYRPLEKEEGMIDLPNGDMIEAVAYKGVFTGELKSVYFTSLVPRSDSDLEKAPVEVFVYSDKNDTEVSIILQPMEKERINTFVEQIQRFREKDNHYLVHRYVETEEAKDLFLGSVNRKGESDSVQESTLYREMHKELWPTSFSPDSGFSNHRRSVELEFSRHNSEILTKATIEKSLNEDDEQRSSIEISPDGTISATSNEEHDFESNIYKTENIVFQWGQVLAKVKNKESFSVFAPLLPVFWDGLRPITFAYQPSDSGQGIIELPHGKSVEAEYFSGILSSGNKRIRMTLLFDQESLDQMPVEIFVYQSAQGENVTKILEPSGERSISAKKNLWEGLREAEEIAFAQDTLSINFTFEETTNFLEQNDLPADLVNNYEVRLDSDPLWNSHLGRHESTPFVHLTGPGEGRLRLRFDLTTPDHYQNFLGLLKDSQPIFQRFDENHEEIAQRLKNQADELVKISTIGEVRVHPSKKNIPLDFVLRADPIGGFSDGVSPSLRLGPDTWISADMARLLIYSLSSLERYRNAKLLATGEPVVERISRQLISAEKDRARVSTGILLNSLYSPKSVPDASGPKPSFQRYDKEEKDVSVEKPAEQNGEVLLTIPEDPENNESEE